VNPKKFPRSVRAMTTSFDAWIVGSAATTDSPKDIDVMVPWSRWHEAVTLIPSSASPNTFGGWKYTEDGVDIDVWPDSLDRLAALSQFIIAWHPKSGRIVKGSY
jgi:hypothetical protein